LAQRVGARLYVRVDGPLTPALTMSGAVISYLGTWNPFGRGTARIGFDLTDTGNTRLSARPAIQVTGPFGIKLAEADLELVENLMPGGTAHVTADLTGVAPLFLLFGHFQVTPVGAQGAVGNDDLPGALSAGASVLAIPWAALALIVLVVGGCFGILLQRRRFHRRWTQDMAALAQELSTAGLDDAAGLASPEGKVWSGSGTAHHSEALR
jgi:hypothetical protein